MASRSHGEPRVNVVIPSRGALALLAQTLASLSRQSYRSFDITVVDDASSPQLPSDLSVGRARVSVVRLEISRGIGSAINAGIAATSAELVALLNNDVELEPRWLEVLVEALDRHPEAGSVAGKLLMFHDRSRLDGAGDIVHRSGAPLRRGYGEADNGQYDRPEWVFSASAAAAVYRRGALNDVGPFDSDFYAYLEDVDWGFRAQLLGYRCLYVPSAVAYHVGSATTTADTSSTKLFEALLRRNSVTLVVKNFPARTLLRSVPSIAAFHGRWLLRSARAGSLRSHGNAYRCALSDLPRTLQKRREIQRRRRVPPSYIESLLTRPQWRRAIRRLGSGAL
ncbi:MAG: glycosyltransferase family 2 protein [Gaiellaceae bacterium]